MVYIFSMYYFNILHFTLIKNQTIYSIKIAYYINYITYFTSAKYDYIF